jgi:hypothetical protein
MMTRTTAMRMAMPRLVLRKGKRRVSFDCQLLVAAACVREVVLMVVGAPAAALGVV